jgi:hypothetical protein
MKKGVKTINNLGKYNIIINGLNIVDLIEKITKIKINYKI